MLIQLTTPRITFNSSRHEHHVYIHTLAMPNVSAGEVRFTGPTDPEHGKKATIIVEPKEILPLDEGLSVKIHVLPFWELFNEGPKKVEHDGAMVRAANLKVVQMCTAGFQVLAKSAFRAGPRSYEEHQIAFSMKFPATGGGLLQITDSLMDFVNTSFNPWACNPSPLSESTKAELKNLYARSHILPKGRSDIDDQRKTRIAAATASMEKEQAHPAPSSKGSPNTNVN